jgi:hypothetical protein
MGGYMMRDRQLRVENEMNGAAGGLGSAPQLDA